jgi:23S rRNA (guanosine2251-2'-O)-methyltransferase
MVARGAAESTSPLRELAGNAGVPVAFVDTVDLDALSFGGNHQGVVATLAPTPSLGLRDLLQHQPGRAQPPLILAADQVEDVGNLGSLVRTLEACGGAGVIVPQRRSASLTGGLARASAGASLRSTVRPESEP